MKISMTGKFWMTGLVMSRDRWEHQNSSILAGFDHISPLTAMGSGGWMGVRLCGTRHCSCKKERLSKQGVVPSLSVSSSSALTLSALLDRTQ